MSEEQASAPAGDPFDEVWDAAVASEQEPTETEGAGTEPETVEEPATPSEPTGDRPRDEQGRFVKAETDKAEAETQPSPEDGQPPEPTADAPTEPEEPAAAVAPEVEAQWNALPPVTFRAYGEEIPIAGSKLGPEGAFIPKESLSQVTRMLSSGREYDRRAQEWGEQIKAAKAQAEGAQTTATTILSQLDAMVESGQIHEWLADVERNWPILKANAEKEGIKRQLETGNEELARYRAQQEEARLRPVMDSALRDTLGEFGKQAGLTAEDLGQLYQDLRQGHWAEVVFPKAQQDMPQLGVKAGQRVINRSVIEREVQRVAGLLQRYRGTAPATPAPPPPQVQAAAQKNAQTAKAVAAQQGKKPVPAVPATRGPAPGNASRPQFKSTEEVDEWFSRGGYNEAFD